MSEDRIFLADGRCLGFRDKEMQGAYKYLRMRDKEVKGYNYVSECVT